MTIKIYSPEETSQYIVPIEFGYRFIYKTYIAEGVNVDQSTYKLLSKEFVQNILNELNKEISLDWADLEIFCLPFVYMQWTKKGGFSGQNYLGRAWNDTYILSAIRKDQPDNAIAATIAHELFHVFAYKFIDNDAYDVKDTENYAKFKELIGLKGVSDKNAVLWSQKPSEILAELMRLSLRNPLFNSDPSTIFENNDISEFNEAVEYLHSFLPEGGSMIKDGLIQGNDINGVPFKIDLIPKSNISSRPQYSMITKSITVHNTGNSKKGANAEMNSEYVDNTTNYISWHFTVDDKQIFQELPINESAWHAGDGRNGKGNRTSIGIEICEQEGIDWEKAKENGIKLIKFLIENISTIDEVVPHQHWTGKYCPHLILDEGWDKFMAQINNSLVGYKIVKEVPIVVDGEEIQIKAPMIETSEGGITFLPIRNFLQDVLRDKWGIDLTVDFDGRVLIKKVK